MRYFIALALILAGCASKMIATEPAALSDRDPAALPFAAAIDAHLFKGPLLINVDGSARKPAI